MAEAYYAEPIFVAAARSKILAKLAANGLGSVPVISDPADSSVQPMPYVTCYDGNEEEDWRAQFTEGSVVLANFGVYTRSPDETRRITGLIRRALGERPNLWVLPSGYKLVTLRPLTVRQGVFIDNNERIYEAVCTYRASVSITKT